MWPFRRRPRVPEVWEMFPPGPSDRAGHLDDEERRFIFWAVETSPVVTRKDLKESKRMYLGAQAAGHHAMADSMLDMTLSLNGTNIHRIARDDAYWEEYQRVMIGRRVDRVGYIVGRMQPTGDRRPWKIHPTRAREQPPDRR